jgi:hypothetical protein
MPYYYLISLTISSFVLIFSAIALLLSSWLVFVVLRASQPALTLSQDGVSLPWQACATFVVG